MNLEIILMDNAPHTQKTLYYFLRHYTPVIHPFHDKNNFPAPVKDVRPDVIFLDSEQIPHKHHLDKFQKLKSSPPVILISKNEDFLKNPSHASDYQGALKKPINPKELQSLIQKCVPKTKDLKITSFLNFFSPPAEQPKNSKPVQQAALSQTKDSAFAELEPALEKPGPPPAEGLSANKPNTAPIAIGGAEAPLHSQPAAAFQEKSENQPALNSLNPSKTLKDSKNFTKKPKVIQDIDSTDQIHITSPGTPLSSLEPDPPQDSPKNESREKTHKQDFFSEETKQILKKIIHTTIEAKLQTEQESLKKDLSQEMQNQIESKINKIFLENIKELLNKKGIEILKKTTEDIAWKVIPDLSKQLIQKEIHNISKK